MFLRIKQFLSEAAEIFRTLFTEKNEWIIQSNTTKEDESSKYRTKGATDLELPADFGKN